MSKKKEKPIDLKNLEPEEKLKYEVAEELGLLDKVLSQGWKSLTSKETGRIGGLVTKKKKQENRYTYRKQIFDRIVQLGRQWVIKLWQIV